MTWDQMTERLWLLVRDELCSVKLNECTEVQTLSACVTEYACSGVLSVSYVKANECVSAIPT